MSFGTRLQALRRGSELTQEEFAQQLNVSRQAVSKWESSKGYPEVEKLLYISSHYGVPLSELFQDEVPPVSEPLPPGDEGPAPEPLKSPPLKKSLGNFFTNLSPRSQFHFLAVAALVLASLLVLFCIFIVKGEKDQMTLKLVWTALLLLFTAAEAVSVGLTTIWFAAGALCALVVALLGGPLWLQLALFLAVSILCLLAVRPVARKYLNSKVERTNADRIIGTHARVTEDIDNLAGTGAVRADGKVWTARSEEGARVPAGSTVRILRIEGVKVFVETTKEEVKC